MGEDETDFLHLVFGFFNGIILLGLGNLHANIKSIKI